MAFGGNSIRGYLFIGALCSLYICLRRGGNRNRSRCCSGGLGVSTVTCVLGAITVVPELTSAFCLLSFLLSFPLQELGRRCWRLRLPLPQCRGHRRSHSLSAPFGKSAHQFGLRLVQGVLVGNPFFGGIFLFSFAVVETYLLYFKNTFFRLAGDGELIKNFRSVQ